MIRRLLIGLALLVLIVTITASTMSRADFDTVPYPSHIEWSEYTVPSPGYIIVSPEADSLGNHEALPLPGGTEVYIPRLVSGPDPNGPPSHGT